MILAAGLFHPWRHRLLDPGDAQLQTCPASLDAGARPCGLPSAVNAPPVTAFCA